MKYTNKSGVEYRYGAQLGHTDVGKPVNGRYDAIRASEESLKDLWSDKSFQKFIKKQIPKKKRTSKGQPLFPKSSPFNNEPIKDDSVD